MFDRKKLNNPAIRTLISADTRVTGDVEFNSSFHVDGYIKGNVKATQHENVMLNISERGCVEGSIEVSQLVIDGTVKGNIRATEKVELGPKARVIGNIQYKSIEMSLGAEVNGKLIYESDSTRNHISEKPQIAPVSAINRIKEK
jgi:cytoskeletal protein CcmA (bactofilin family)